MKSNPRINNIEKRLEKKIESTKLPIPIMVTKCGEKYYRGIFGNRDLEGDELTQEEINQITGIDPTYHGGEPLIIEFTDFSKLDTAT